jgi:hypothetical protein
MPDQPAFCSAALLAVTEAQERQSSVLAKL